MSYPVRMASIDACRLVATEGPIRIRFPDSNKTTLLDVLTASAIVAVHGALNADNQAKIERMLRERHKFLRVVDFAWKHVRPAVS